MSELREQIQQIWRTAEEPLQALWEWAKKPEQEERRHERWSALEKWAGSHKRDEDHDSEEFKAWRSRQRIYRKKAKGTAGGDEDVPGIEDGGWHPDAIRNQVQGGIGAMSGPPKIVWHTTEGFGLPQYAGSHPHFTLDPRTGKLYQHISIRSGAMALKNLSGGVETNRDGAIQVELIWFAAQTQNGTEEMYEHIADLARWIEKHAGVPRKCNVQFVGNASGSTRMSGSTWDGYSGHCGHQHVPENDHWDPGDFQIDKVI